MFLFYFSVFFPPQALSALFLLRFHMMNRIILSPHQYSLMKSILQHFKSSALKMDLNLSQLMLHRIATSLWKWQAHMDVLEIPVQDTYPSRSSSLLSLLQLCILLEDLKSTRGNMDSLVSSLYHIIRSGQIFQIL